MVNPPRDAESYALEQLAALPRGSIWPRDLSGRWGGFLLGSSEELARVRGASEILLRELDPTTTADMLTDWEQAYGLPDPCVALPATTEERRRRLVQLVRMKASTRPKFLTRIAHDLGFDVLLEEFAPATMGISRMGATMDGEDWRWVIFCHSPPTAVFPAYMGVSHCGEYLLDFGNDPLECVLRRHIPATSRPYFIMGFDDPQDTFGAAAVWQQPGPASGASTAMPTRAAGATYFLVGTFAAEAFVGSDAAYGLIASSTRVSVGASAGGDSPRATVPIAPGAGRALISIVQRDEGGQRSIDVRVNGAAVGQANVAGVGAIAGNAIAWTAAGLEHLGMKQWPLEADEVDWLERVLARQFAIPLADWPETPEEEGD